MFFSNLSSVLRILCTMLIICFVNFILRPFDAAVSHTIIAHLMKGNIEMADKIKEYVNNLIG